MFKFGPPFEARELFDRELELSLLRGSFKALKKGVRKDYALVGVRRIGKTSLLNKLREETLKAGVACVLLDCEGLGFESFGRHYGAAVVDALFKKTGLVERMKKRALDVLREAPSALLNSLSEMAGRARGLGIKTAGDYLEFYVRFAERREARRTSEEELREFVEKTLDLPELLATEHKTFFTIMLDEFQELASFSSHDYNFFAAMRRVIHRHKRVNYVVAGSNIGMMKNIVLSPEHAFGANFLVEWVKPFDDKTAENFLLKGFAEARIKADKAALKQMIGFTGGHPAYLNWFGEQCVRSNKASLSHVEKLEDTFFSPSGLGPLFEKELVRISRKSETKSVAILRTLALKELSSPTEIARAVGGITPSNAITYLNRLENYGYVQKNAERKYEFTDPSLKKYLAVKYESA